MPTLLRGNEKLEIHKAETRAFRHRVGCSSRVARSNWLIAPFEAAFAAGFGGTPREQRTPFKEDVVSGLATEGGGSTVTFANRAAAPGV
jgi:hypothetical protein